MDVKRARELLGDESHNFSDEEVERLIEKLSVFASDLLDLFEQGEL